MISLNVSRETFVKSIFNIARKLKKVKRCRVAPDFLYSYVSIYVSSILIKRELVIFKVAEHVRDGNLMQLFNEHAHRIDRTFF